MKGFSVQQISKLLKTNPETVRRWIRSGKLLAIQDSRKTGNFVSEEALKKFMLSTPKYAGLIATIFASTSIILGSLMGSIISTIYGQKKSTVTPDYMKNQSFKRKKY